MKNIRPFSALYYIKENRFRAYICVFMMFMGTLIFLAGNYIYSVIYSFHKEFEYSDKLVEIDYLSNDVDNKDFDAVINLINQDEKLNYVRFSAYGFGGMQHNTVLNLDVGGQSFVFNSVEDARQIFDRLGVDADLSRCTNNSLIISSDLACDRGLKLGDKVDRAFDSCFSREHTIDAIIDDGSLCTFYIYEVPESNLMRLYVYSDTLEGKELYDYVRELAKGKQVKVTDSERDFVMPQFRIFFVLFYGIDILIAIVLAVTINSVITGQYLKRTYEFGVYNALGMGRGLVKKKVTREILTMNTMAIIIGFLIIILYTYLVNELLYKPSGRYLVYISKLGILGFILCDLLIVVPLILSKGRLMSKADVTEF